MRICSIEGCEAKHQAKGFCHKHYQRFRINGDPLYRYHPFQYRFEQRVELIPFSTCHWWVGTQRNGYGIIKNKGKIISSHRASYTLYIGPIPEGLFVLHKCDNPPCVNPDHLFLGTCQDNATDKVKKGRQPKGEAVGTSKLKEKDIIRIHHLSGTKTQTQIAEIFGVSQAHISKIIRRVWWGHVQLDNL